MLRREVLNTSPQLHELRHHTPMPPARAREIAAGCNLSALTPDFLANPYPVRAALREHEPVRRMPDGSVFLTRCADLMAVYRDAQTFSPDKQVDFAPRYGVGSALFERHTTCLVFNDPPLHTRVRRTKSVARCASGRSPS